MKICPKCKKVQEDPSYLGCAQCKVTFIDEEELVTHFTRDELKIIAGFILKDWRVYVVAGVFLLVGVGLLYWQAREHIKIQIAQFQTTVSNQVVTAYSTATNQISSQFKIFAADASNQVSQAYSSVTNQIAEDFQTPRIKQTVENVAKGEAKSILEIEVQPAVDKFRAEMAGKLDLSNQILNQLTNYMRYAETLLAAENEDRAAFDRLKLWAASPDNPFQKPSEQAMDAIMNAHNNSDALESAGFTKVQYTPPDAIGNNGKISLKDLEKINETTGYYMNRLGLIQHILSRDDFTKQDKMNFLINVIKNDNHLKVVSYAGLKFREMSGWNYKTLATDDFVSWWAAHKDDAEKTSK